LTLSVIAALAMSTSAVFADEVPRSAELVNVPEECVQYWSIPTGAEARAAWDQVLSFAACIQDASVARIERADQLPGFVEQLHVALTPSVMFYVAAIERGPWHVKIRAAYQLGMAHVALMTRARSSIAKPAESDAAAAAASSELHARLEPLLERHAKLAHVLFSAIERVVATDPSVASDAVTQNMVRSARQLADVLGKSWSIPRELPEAPPMLASPH
jgi:hypothetical protein